MGVSNVFSFSLIVFFLKNKQSTSRVLNSIQYQMSGSFHVRPAAVCRSDTHAGLSTQLLHWRGFNPKKEKDASL